MGVSAARLPHLFLILSRPPLALLTQAGSTALDVRLAGIVLLPEAVERLQHRLDVAPDADVEGKGVAQFGMVVAHTDDHTGLLEAQIDRAATTTLAIAHTAHHVVGFFRERFDRANVIGVVHRETAVVEHTRRHGQGQTLGKLDDLTLGVRVANVDATDQRGIFGVQ